MVSHDRQLCSRLTRELACLMHITLTTGLLAEAYRHLQDQGADLIFVDIREDRASYHKLVPRIRFTRPGTRVFLISDTRDAETILAGFRSGAADFISSQISGPRLVAAVKNALARARTGAGMGEVFTLFSLKGGLGVTTAAMNLADQVCTLTRDKVLLLDLNLFMGDITSYLDIAPGFTPYDLAGDLARMDDELLFSSLFRHPRGFYVLTTPEEINDSDQITSKDIEEMMELFRQEFDYIIVDAPHDFSERTLRVIRVTDRLLVLAQQSIPSARSVQKIMEFLGDIDFPADRIRLVVNRHLRKSELRKSDLEQIFRQKIAFCIDNDYPLLMRAAHKGATIAQVSAGSRISRQMAKMAADLSGMTLEQGPPWKRWAARIKGK